MIEPLQKGKRIIAVILTFLELLTLFLEEFE